MKITDLEKAAKYLNDYKLLKSKQRPLEHELTHFDDLAITMQLGDFEISLSSVDFEFEGAAQRFHDTLSRFAIELEMLFQEEIEHLEYLIKEL